MSQHAKGPRLYLRRGRKNSRTGERLPDVYFIRDGSVERSTGCGPERLSDAEGKLAEYIAEKWTPPTLSTESRRDPGQVLVADVLALYALEKAPHTADPSFVAGNIQTLTAWWGDQTISEVKRSTCQAYAAHRQTQPDRRYKDAEKAPRVSSETARRELEDLSAAIGHWHGEDALTTRPMVWLPDKSESPRDALTRSQAAALLKASLGWRVTKKRGKPDRWERLGKSARANRAHIRRFLLIGFYTGTRHTVMRELLWEESAVQPWLDLDKAVIFRRGKAVREQRNKKTPVVKIPPRLLAHLRRWRAMDHKLGMADDGEDIVVSVLHHGGAPISGKIRTGFASCVRDAGLPAEITPHWMRHTAATWLMEAGVDVWKASAFLGMNPQTLIDHYGHHRPDYQADAAQASGGRRTK